MAATMALLLVVGTLGSIPVSGIPGPMENSVVAASDQESTNQPNENASDVAPGERLSGAVGVQSAEFEGEMERRTFGIRVAKAPSNESKADVVKTQLNSIEARLAALEQQKADLEEARENGNISEGRYRAEIAKLAAQTETVKQLADDSEEQANGLPADLLMEKEINVSAIQTLKYHAGNLSGPEVAEIARSIAGDNVGAPVDRGASDQAGPAGGDEDRASQSITRASQQINTAQDRLADARDRINESNASDETLAALGDAEAELEQAEQSLEDARDAMDDGDYEAAIQAAEEALDHATQALDRARDALAQANQPGGGADRNGDGKSAAGSQQGGSP